MITPSGNIMLITMTIKDLLLVNWLANLSKIFQKHLYEGYIKSRAYDQDGRHAHIWKKPFEKYSSMEAVD